jgi:glycosyltransferase involved in cell wall biosynthesis
LPVLALERLLRDEKLRRELGRRGAEMVRANFRFENFRDNLRAILANYLNSPSIAGVS